MSHRIKHKLICGIVVSLMIIPLYSVYATSHAPGQLKDRGSSASQHGSNVEKGSKQDNKNVKGNKATQNPTTSPSPLDKGCQKREQSIQKRSSQLVRMATNMLEVFERIAQRVRTYYLTVVIPSGQSLDQYSELLANIDLAKAAVENALEEAANTASTFDCGSSDPKQQLQKFRQDMKNVKKTLKTYRTSVKDLIVGVRSITNKNKPEASPTPSVSPTSTPSAIPTPTTTP
jgi:preprotein translocase subunit SecD